MVKLVQAVVAVSGGIRPGIIRLMYSSKSARSVLPLVTLALAIGVEVRIVGSWVSTVAAAAVSMLALAAFALALTLTFGRGRVEGAFGLKVVYILVMVCTPNLFGRVASSSAIVWAAWGDMANFTTGVARLGIVRLWHTGASARTFRMVGLGISGTARGTSRRIRRGRFTHGGKRIGTLPCFFRFPLFRLGTPRC